MHKSAKLVAAEGTSIKFEVARKTENTEQTGAINIYY